MKAALLILCFVYSINCFSQNDWKCWKTVKGTWAATDYADTSKQNPSYLFNFNNDGTIEIMIPAYKFPKTFYKIDKEKNLLIVDYEIKEHNVHFAFKYIDKSTLKWQRSISPNIISGWDSTDDVEHTSILKWFKPFSSTVTIPKQSDSLMEDNQIFTKEEIPAQFIGGDNAWTIFLQTNMSKNVPINNGAPDGAYKIIIHFVVKKDGSIDGIEPETHIGYGMEQEAVRVIKESGKWIPAKQNNHIVNSYVWKQFTFVVGDE